jgi:hypothetical protein
MSDVVDCSGYMGHSNEYFAPSASIRLCTLHEFNLGDFQLEQLVKYNSMHNVPLLNLIINARGRHLYCLIINGVFSCIIVLKTECAQNIYKKNMHDFCEYFHLNRLSNARSIFYPMIGMIIVVVL